MLKSSILHTCEIDDVRAALREVVGQLQEIQLLKNTVGIMVCHYDFITSGAAAEIAAALPFPVLGITTFYQATSACSGLFELTITILTSDDARFSIACSGGAEGTPDAVIRDTYARAAAECGEPELILAFISAKRPVSGDHFLRLLDKHSGGVPTFGSVTTGDDEMGSNVYVLYDGKVLSEGFALLLIDNVQFSCAMGNYRADSLLEMTFTVTRAEGTHVLELNGQRAASCLRKNSFALPYEEKDSVTTVPFLYKMPSDERLVARTLSGFSEKGALNFMAEIPEGAVLRVCAAPFEEILQTSAEAAREALQGSSPSLLLMFSCIGRYIMLGLNQTAETERVIEAVPEEIPYLFSYAGGEICPVIRGGKLANCYHNASFVICALS